MEDKKTVSAPIVQNLDKSSTATGAAAGGSVKEAIRSEGPANSLISAFERGDRIRVPMSVPQQKLAVPDIPGYHLHWMADRVGRIMQALNAGYEYVNQEEVHVNNLGFADDKYQNGSTDLGTRISVVGGAGEAGQVLRLYLMKIREEWWREDQAKLSKRSASVMEVIKKTGIREGPDGSKVDAENTYVKADITPSMFPGRKSMSS